MNDVDQQQPGNIDLSPGQRFHAHVADQPGSLFELSPTLLSKYEVENGTVTIAGCSIDDEPIFAVTRLAEQRSGSEPIVQYFDRTGWQLDSELVASLGLTSAVDLAQLPASIRPSFFQQCLQQAGREIAAQASPDRIELKNIIWCKRATGKVAVRIGEHTAQISFIGWTRRLKNGADPLAPYVCPLSGKASFHVVADDDGRLTVAEAIAVCAVSGRRVVETVLEQSALSGKRALPQYLADCCLSGDRVLQSELIGCHVCEQPISPQSVLTKGCRGCHEIPKGDLQTVKHYTDVWPGLAKWKSIHVRETYARIFVSATRGWHRILIVADKSTHQILSMKQAPRFFGKWQRMEIEEASKDLR